MGEFLIRFNKEAIENVAVTIPGGSEWLRIQQYRSEELISLKAAEESCLGSKNGFKPQNMVLTIKIHRIKINKKIHRILMD